MKIVKFDQICRTRSLTKTPFGKNRNWRKYNWLKTKAGSDGLRQKRNLSKLTNLSNISTNSLFEITVPSINRNRFANEHKKFSRIWRKWKWSNTDKWDLAKPKVSFLTRTPTTN